MLDRFPTASPGQRGIFLAGLEFCVFWICRDKFIQVFEIILIIGINRKYYFIQETAVYDKVSLERRVSEEKTVHSGRTSQYLKVAIQHGDKLFPAVEDQANNLSWLIIVTRRTRRDESLSEGKVVNRSSECE